MLSLHVDVCLGIDQHLLRLENFLVGPLRLLKGSRLDGGKVVITGLRLFREAQCTPLTIRLSVSLDESPYRSHAPCDLCRPTENLSPANGSAGEHIDCGDAPVGDGPKMRGVLLIQSHLAGDRRECAGGALHQHKCDVDSSTLLILRRNLDDVVRLRPTFCGFIRLVLRAGCGRGRLVGRAGAAGLCLFFGTAGQKAGQHQEG